SFYARNTSDDGYHSERFLGGYDTPIELGIVLDTANMEVWGTYDFGGGNTGATSHYAVTGAMLDDLDLFTMTFDMRTGTSTPVGGQYVGAQFDNLLVEASGSLVPLPATFSLFIAGLPLLRRRTA
ncbi:MAG: hypothetical protein ACPGUC_11755, partial [Gammaproteobacteria bacterium]